MEAGYRFAKLSTVALSVSLYLLGCSLTPKLSPSEIGIAPPPTDAKAPKLPLPQLDPDLPKGVVIFGNPKQAWKVFYQCSRHVPSFDIKTWLPNVSTVVKADEMLSRLSASEEICRPPRPFDGFIRQYVGVTTADGVTGLYVNGAYYFAGDTDDFTEPVSACEGGSYYWGAFIDLDAGRVHSIQVNGRFSGGFECDLPMSDQSPNDG